MKCPVCGYEVVDSFAFSFNDNIYELEIADGVKVLESDAFTSMPNLKSITVPDSVKEMDDCGLGIGVDDDFENVPIKGFKMYCKKRFGRRNICKRKQFVI